MSGMGYPIVVAFCGYSRTGKDTAAARLIERGYRLGSTGIAVSEMLIRENSRIRLADGTSPRIAQLFADHGYEGAKLIPEVRSRMQDYGLALVAADPTALVGILLAGRSPEEALVLTGIRAPAEAELIQAAGGAVLRVHRPGIEPMNGHPVDRDVDAIAPDAHIVNDGAVSDLHDLVDETLGIIAGIARYPRTATPSAYANAK